MRSPETTSSNAIDWRASSGALSMSVGRSVKSPPPCPGAERTIVYRARVREIAERPFTVVVVPGYTTMLPIDCAESRNSSPTAAAVTSRYTANPCPASTSTSKRLTSPVTRCPVVTLPKASRSEPLGSVGESHPDADAANRRINASR
jgi:hypothetical protein